MQTEKLLHLMDSITNIRSYLDKPISHQAQQYLFEAYGHGHSSTGNQARELLVITDPELRQKTASCTLSPYLVKEKGNQAWLEDVPFLAITLIEKRRAIARVGDAGIVIAEREAEGALQNMRLAAAVMKIATAVIREFEPEKLKEALELPWYVEPIAIMTAGYPKKMKDKEPRFSVEEIIHKDRWI